MSRTSIELISLEGERFTIEGCTGHSIRFPSAVLQKIVDYTQYHAAHPDDIPSIPRPIPSTRMVDFVSEWDATFIDVNHVMLFQLTQAARDLGIPSLLMLACAKIASQLKGKTPEQIRSTFQFENDYTPKEEAAIRREQRGL